MCVRACKRVCCVLEFVMLLSRTVSPVVPAERSAVALDAGLTGSS